MLLVLVAMRNKEFTVQEAAEMLDVGLLYVYTLLRDKKLKGRKQDGRWLISEQSIAARKERLASRTRTSSGTA